MITPTANDDTPTVVVVNRDVPGSHHCIVGLLMIIAANTAEPTSGWVWLATLTELVWYSSAAFIFVRGLFRPWKQ